MSTLLVISTGCTSMAGMGTDASAINGTRGSKTALMTTAQANNYATQQNAVINETNTQVHVAQGNRKLKQEQMAGVADIGNGIRDGVNSAKEAVYSIKDFFSSFRR